MPIDQQQRAQIAWLGVLILAVPVQYLLTKTSSENFRQYEIKRVISGLSDLSDHYFSLDGWIQWCGDLWKHYVIGNSDTEQPPSEVLKNQNKNGHFHWRKLPNYAVLVDTRDRLTPQMAYVVEENLEVVSNQRIFHPLIEHYFEGFDGAQYLARPWLKTVYPHD